MKNTKVTLIAQAGMIAAVYVVLTLVFSAISYSEIQVRISEALTILPYFTPAAIPGLFVGCIIANILGGSIALDVVFGSLATLIGAIFTRILSKKNKYLAPVPPILANALIVPFVLRYGYTVPLPIPYMMLTVGAGEIISCGILGMLLLFALEKSGAQAHIFGNSSVSGLPK
ncbi:MAG: QueT transporter family protein [Blautia sp.]|nr:QueT transporter family protein [Blautia sp.]